MQNTRLNRLDRTTNCFTPLSTSRQHAQHTHTHTAWGPFAPPSRTPSPGLICSHFVWIVGLHGGQATVQRHSLHSTPSFDLLVETLYIGDARRLAKVPVLLFSHVPCPSSVLTRPLSALPVSATSSAVGWRDFGNITWPLLQHTHAER